MITGPESCGISQFIQRAIVKANPNGLHILDCDRYASSTAAGKGGILNGFVRSSGYNTMPKILGDLKLGRERTSAVNDEELELCFLYHNEVSWQRLLLGYK